MSQPIRFVLDYTNDDIVRMLYEIAPTCQTCSRKKLHICMERSCRGVGAICIICNKETHRAHRINELRLLFVDIKELRPFLEMDIANMNTIHDALMEMQCRIRMHVDELLKLANICGEAAEEVYHLKSQPKYDWYSELHKIAADVLTAEKIETQFSERLAKVLSQVDFDPAHKLKLRENSTMHTFLGLYQEYSPKGLNQPIQTSLIEKIKRITTTGQQIYTLEDFNLELHMKNWLTCGEKFWELQDQICPSFAFQKDVLDASYRSRCSKNSECKGERQAMLGAWKQKNVVVRQQLLELHTTAEMDVPPMLQSLSYWGTWGIQGRFNNEFVPKGGKLALPRNLRRLRISYELASKHRVFTRLHEVPELYCLVVGGDLPPGAQDQIHRQLPQLKKLRAFTLLLPKRMVRNSLLSRPSVTIDYEDLFVQKNTRWKQHYLKYRRAIMQAVLISRFLYTLKDFKVDYMLEMFIGPDPIQRRLPGLQSH